MEAESPDTVPASLLAGASFAPTDCRISLTPLGETVAAAWREISMNWPGVEALDLQVMPEHLHGIIRVVKPQRHPLGQIVGSFKARATGRGKACAIKLASTGSLWSEGFNDSILWSDERRARATHYLKTNPYRLASKFASTTRGRLSPMSRNWRLRP